MTWGSSLKSLQERLAAGKPAPALENMPELYEDLQDVWEGFWQLHRCRQYGFGPCPLAVREILAMAELYDIRAEDRMEYFELIKGLDQEWLQWTAEQANKGKGK